MAAGKTYDLKLYQPAMVGNTELKAGEYRVEVNDTDGRHQERQSEEGSGREGGDRPIRKYDTTTVRLSSRREAADPGDPPRRHQDQARVRRTAPEAPGCKSARAAAMALPRVGPPRRRLLHWGHAPAPGPGRSPVRRLARRNHARPSIFQSFQIAQSGLDRREHRGERAAIRWPRKAFWCWTGWTGWRPIAGFPCGPGAELTRASILKIGDSLDASTVIYGSYELTQPATAQSKGSLRIEARIVDLKRTHQGPLFSETGALEDLAVARSAARLAGARIAARRRRRRPRSEFLAARPPVRLDAVESYVRGLLARPRRSSGIASSRRRRGWTSSTRSPAFNSGKIYWERKEYKIAAGWFQRVTRTDPHLSRIAILPGPVAVLQRRFRGRGGGFPTGRRRHAAERGVQQSRRRAGPPEQFRGRGREFPEGARRRQRRSRLSLQSRLRAAADRPVRRGRRELPRRSRAQSERPGGDVAPRPRAERGSPRVPAIRRSTAASA